MKFGLSDTKLNFQSGITIIETMLAVVLTLFAAASLYQASYFGMAYMERQAHRRLALTIANSKMDECRINVSYKGNLDLPNRPVKTVIDPRDPDDKKDDLYGYVQYGRPEPMRETINGLVVEDYYRCWVRVYWYEDDDKNDIESVELVSYFTKKN